MSVTNVVQSIWILILYSLMTVFMPAVVMHKRIAKRRLCEKFLICVVAGNFYIINVVFILQFLHISNRFTLFCATFVAAFVYMILRNRTKSRQILIKIVDIMSRLARNTMGRRTFFSKCGNHIKSALKKLIIKIKNYLKCYGWETFLTLCLCAVVCVIYGSNGIINYGYTASDTPVHNYWINAMSDNNVFVAGVYPHGFHCIIYYMHAVFGIDTYVLLRLFTVTSALYIHLALFAFCKGVCRGAYSAYAAVFIFAAVNLLNKDCIIRYTNNLPQEYGMIFILPTVYFIFEFFRHQKMCPKKIKIKETALIVEGELAAEDLIYAAVSFSLTIAVHFYGTMIAGIFCIGIVFGFLIRIVQPRFMARIIAAFTLGVILGVLPLATAVIMGKPMQGSIGWGLSVISGNKTTTGINIDTSGQNSSGTSSGGQSSDSADFGQQGEVQGDAAYNDEDGQNGTQSVKKQSFADKLKQKAGVVYYKFADLFGRAYRNLNHDIEAAVFPHGGDFYLGFVFISCAVLIIFGIIFGISRDYDYGGRIITVAFSIIFIHMMFIAGVFGLPKLMDQNRTRIYMTYSLAVLVALDFDIVPYIISRFINLKTLYNTISLAICVVAVIRVVDVYGLREPIVYSKIGMLESNGAVECLSNIIKDNKDRTWTILSANDELRMMDKHGYHYETLDLLKDMKKNPDKRITIPTKYLYIYVEKTPLNYSVAYDKSGQKVSREGAATPLPQYGGIVSYTGRYRWVVMSKMYYWAQELQKLFPEDVSVYYEDDDFICYKLVQNTSNLYNLNIDYEYRN